PVTAGTPSGTYATTAINWDTYATDNGLKNLRICYAATALNYPAYTSHVLSHSQIINCQNAVSVGSGATANLRNVLVHNQSGFITGSYFASSGSAGRIVGENLTIDQVGTLKPSGVTLNLTNTLLAGVSSWGVYSLPVVDIGTHLITTDHFQL